MGPRLRFLAKLTGPPHLRLRFLRSWVLLEAEEAEEADAEAAEM